MMMITESMLSKRLFTRITLVVNTVFGSHQRTFLRVNGFGREGFCGFL